MWALVLAELWTSTMGDLLHQARRVEVIDVTAVKDRAIDGKLEVGVRSGAKVGDPIHVDLGYLPVPKVGDRVLVICDSECPRAIGVEHQGVYQLVAQEPGDGAFVTPNVVTAAALAPLAAGQPAKDLCVKGLVDLLDDPKQPGIELRIGAGDGRGGGVVAGHRVNARMTVPWFASEHAAIALDISGKADVELVAGKFGFDADGCVSGTFAPSRPLPRTSASLVTSLDQQLPAQVLARGKLGNHELVFSVDPDGSLVLASDLAGGGVAFYENRPGHLVLGFDARGAVTAGVNTRTLIIDLAATVPSGYEHAAALGRALRATRTAKISWTEAAQRTELGSVQLTYVRYR